MINTVRVICGLFSGAALFGSWAQAAPGGEAAEPAACSVLATAGMFQSTTVKWATWIPIEGGRPAYCEVAAMISPESESHIGVVYRLPDHWNGSLVGLGGGGWAGNVRIENALGPLALGYATAQTDAGHPSAEPWDTTWAKLADGSQNWPALRDFSYRAIHLMTQVAKQVVTRRYGQAPKVSEFQGCSTGGRQALMEAQRFPDDYDGIIAGAPVFDERTAVGMVNSGRIFDSAQSKLSAAQISAVNQAVLRACDALDGLSDGIVTDPNRCTWDPEVMLCKQGSQADRCLTADQVSAVRRSYQSLRTSYGRVIAYGLARGSELTAFPLFMQWGADVPAHVGLDNVREAQFENPSFSFADWNLARDYDKSRSTPFALLYDAGNPNLSMFVAKGGRLLLWHGLYDQLPRAAATVAYYEEMQRVTGALLPSVGLPSSAVNDATRLFLLPGVSHCAGGPGADSVDTLSIMTAWLAHGHFPEKQIATKKKVADSAGPAASRSTANADSTLFTRPLCPFPTLPYYTGKGSPALADSFACRTSPRGKGT